MASVMTMARTIAVDGGIPALAKDAASLAETTVANPMTKPTDRSIPPVTMTKVSAVARRARVVL